MPNSLKARGFNYFNKGSLISSIKVANISDNFFFADLRQTKKPSARSYQKKPSGTEGDRTLNLMRAKHALSQLSYGPISQVSVRCTDSRNADTANSLSLALVRELDEVDD